MKKEKLEEYLKYYFLEEKYLFGEITKNFETKHYLTPKEFFAIIIWKSNRAKTKYKTESKLKVTAANIKDVTSNLSGTIDGNEEKRTGKMKEMVDAIMKLSGVGLPVASAILTVCHPKDFTIVDYRAKSSLIKFLNNKKLMSDEEIKVDLKKHFKANPSNSIKAYIKYCERCIEEANKLGVELRDFDRMLFGMDFYEGKDGLRNLVKNLG